MGDLLGDDRQGRVTRFLAGARRTQQGDAAADRRQRVAQLVAQHGQEMVLAAVGFLQLGGHRAQLGFAVADRLFAAGPFEPGPEALGELAQELDLVVPPFPRRRTGDRQHEAASAVAHQRHQGQGADAELGEGGGVHPGVAARAARGVADDRRLAAMVRGELGVAEKIALAVGAFERRVSRSAEAVADLPELGIGAGLGDAEEG